MAVNAPAMGGATFFVLVASSFLVSSLKDWIPKQVRISTYIIIIATFVTVVDFSLEAELGRPSKLTGRLVLPGREGAPSAPSAVPAEAPPTVTATSTWW